MLMPYLVGKFPLRRSLMERLEQGFDVLTVRRSETCQGWRALLFLSSLLIAVRHIPYSSARIRFWSSLLESLDDGAYLTLGQTICYSPGARFRLHRSCADDQELQELTSDLCSQQLGGPPQVVAEVRSVGVVSEKADHQAKPRTKITRGLLVH